jgi:hypothetical protein
MFTQCTVKLPYGKANRSVTSGTCQNCESNYAAFSPGAERGIRMRKTTLFTAAVAALVLIGIGTWVGVRILNPTGALAGSTDKRPVMMTGAKGPPTSLNDDSLVVY